MNKVFIDLFQKEDIRYCVQVVANIVYNEIYPYLWL